MDDRVTPPTAEQRLMSESCYTCGEPMWSRGQCGGCRADELEWAVSVTEAQIERLKEQRARLSQQLEDNNKRAEEVQEVIEALEQALKKIQDTE